MPKRKAKSEVTTVVSGDNRRSSKAEKKQKRSKSKSKKKPSKSETNQNAVVASFVRGLSHQIPPASLAHIANSSDSLRLLLEKSMESLPMGSAIRKIWKRRHDELVRIDSPARLLELDVDSRCGAAPPLAE